MLYKKQIGIGLVFSAFLMTIWTVGAVCIGRDMTQCYIPFAAHPFFDPVGPLGLALFLSLIPLYFTKEAVYKAWRIFAVIYIPIAIFLIAVSPEYSDGFLGGSFSMTPDREETTMYMTALLVLISYLLIFTKHRKLKKYPPEESPEINPEDSPKKEEEHWSDDDQDPHTPIGKIFR